MLQLTLAEASNRVKRSVEMRIKEVDPEVYVAVDRLQQFKSQKRDDGELDYVLLIINL